MQKQKIAIIGSGISGLTCAYFLHEQYDITVFEKENRAGGHANTITVNEEGVEVPIDTAVMIFNKANYPNFWALLEKLEVPTQRVTSTISFQYLPTGLEYAVPNIKQIFAVRKDILSPSFLRLLEEILHFGKIVREVFTDERYAEYSLSRYSEEKGLSKNFLFQYLVPLTTALWSTNPKLIMEFPIVPLAHYLDNHHLLGPLGKIDHVSADQCAWRGIVGGTKIYRDKMISFFSDSMHLNSGVKSVRRINSQIEVILENGKLEIFDKVIFACHADQALSLLSDATALEKELLSPFFYKINSIVLHTDSSVMPKNRRAWASFNSRIHETDGNITQIEQHYYLNLLQNLHTKKDYFLAVSSEQGIDPKCILQSFTYSHPDFSPTSAKAQLHLDELNKNPTYFCGSYFRHGFHEDAFISALNVCRAITGNRTLWNKDTK